MTEYKGYEYERRPDGGWNLKFPGGGKMKAPPQTEAELKAGIDAHEESE